MSENAKEEFEFDVAKMTIGDIEDFEEYTGVSIAILGTTRQAPLPTKCVTALLWLMLRKDDPKMTPGKVKERGYRNHVIELTDSSMEASEDPLPEAGTDAG